MNKHEKEIFIIMPLVHVPTGLMAEIVIFDDPIQVSEATSLQTELVVYRKKDKVVVLHEMYQEPFTKSQVERTFRNVRRKWTSFAENNIGHYDSISRLTKKIKHAS